MARGALQVSVGVTGSVLAASGGLAVRPRSSLDTELEVGYLRLSPSVERVRSYRFARLGYRYQCNQPDPAVPAHTGALSLGIGALAQVTRRVGLMANVGVQGSVRRQTIPPPVGFPGGIGDTEATTSSWGVVTGIGVTLRVKPKAAQDN